ncbi:MAG: aminotransferase class IV [Gemmataceae bacterium]
MTHALAIVNGRFIPLEAATLAVTDPGITHGAIVTDVCRTYGGKLFRYDDHLQRFLRDCAACTIDIAFKVEQISAWAHLLAERNPPGVDVLLNTFATPRTLVLRAVPLDVTPYRDGVALWPTPPHPASSSLLPPTVKHRNRFHWYIAERISPPGTLAVTTDEAGHLLETAVGNLLTVRGGVVLTSPAGTVLDGISLRVVRELCLRDEIPVREEPLTADADEALLCGTAFGVAAVRAVGEREYRHPGPVTRRLMAAWDGLHTPSDIPQEPTA